jgi:glycosyltransferase involved in cell wall biosynthesis
MRVGIAIEETWDFFNEIYTDLDNSFETSLFKRRTFHLPVFNTRVNRILFQHDMQQFMQKNDVVFFEWASHLLAAATHMKKECGIVTRLHRYEMYEWVNHINWDAVDRIILVSKAMQTEFINRFPSQANKTIVRNVSISLEKFSFKTRQYHGNIGILCHLIPRKRVYDLILTFAELCEKRNDFSLHIAGDEHPSFTDYAESMKHLVHCLGLEDKVTFYGYISNPAQWYANIDIFISNSFSEGLQVSLIESMASGCYALSHGWKGVEELLPSENIYLKNSEMINKILLYADKSEAEKHLLRTGMRQIACDLCDIDATKREIRTVLQEVYGALHG